MKEHNVDSIQAKRSQSRYLRMLPGFIHNINSPLMNISGRAELIEMRHPEIVAISEILKQLDRVNSDIDSLRYVIELEKDGSQEEVNLSRFFHNFHKFLLFHTRYKHHLNNGYEIPDNLNINTIPRYLVNIFFELSLHCIENAKQDSTIHVRGYEEGVNKIVEIQRTGNAFSEKELSLINDDANTYFDIPEIVGLMLAKHYLNELKGSLNLKQTDGVQQYLVVFQQ